ncbi:hypothetical protein ACS0TY_002724 [Phlomoides rotata]
MGQMENGTPEHESNMTEQSRILKDFTQDKTCEPLASENHQMDYEKLDTKTVEQKEVTEAQDIEKKLVSTQESSDKITEVEPNHEENCQSEGTEKQEPVFSAALEHSGIPPGTASVNSDDGKLEPLHLDAALVHSGNEDTTLSGQSRKAKFKGPVTSSWSLRSKSQEKPKAPEPTDSLKEGSADGEKKKRGRKKKQMQKNTDEFSRMKTHLRYLLHRINYEQYLIDAYSAEGWRGQSVDKLKPEKQLQQAKSHILRYKLRIRALFQQLDMSLLVGKLPESLFDSKGEIDSEDIFCSKCASKDLTLDNDIILCDGTCERGFHQFCLEPPLLKKDIPPGDESWLCPGCDCKAYCIDMLKDYQGTKISIIDSWEKIFPEAAAAALGKTLNDGAGSSSDDSEDEEYDPDKPDTDVKVEGDESSSDESNYLSASDDISAPFNNEKYLGLPSDDSEDDDFDPSAPHQDEQVKQDNSSSDFTSDSEDLGALLEDETALDEDITQILPSAVKLPSTGSIEENPEVGRVKRHPLKDELSYLMETGAEPVSGKRRVERLDYKKLNDETYGNSSDSSDEDFDIEDFDIEDTTSRKRTRTNSGRNGTKSSIETPITKSSIHTKDANQKESKQETKQTYKNGANVGTTELSARVGSASTGTRSSKFNRLGETATQRLYMSFNENQYPEKAVKENLAKELGLTVRQVAKWFENARWSYNHRPQGEPNSSKRPPEPQPTIGTDSTFSNQNVEVSQNSNAEAKEENPATNTGGENSGTAKTRKRKGMVDQEPGDITVSNNGSRR